MNKKLLYTLIAFISMISFQAYATGEDADPSALTTKGYVDTGLKYVYDSIKGDVNNVEGDITNLQNALGDGNGGLINVGNLQDDIDGLSDDVDDLQTVVGSPADGNNPATGLIGTVGDANSGLVKDVNDLKTTVGNASSGLVKRVNELEAASQEYVEGTGIDISENAQGKNVVSLDLGTTQNSTTYVFKTNAQGVGSWQALEVENSWDPTFLTTTTP